MTPITAIIITRNEEKRIAEAIATLTCCDEVLVIDAETGNAVVRRGLLEHRALQMRHPRSPDSAMALRRIRTDASCRALRSD